MSDNAKANELIETCADGTTQLNDRRSFLKLGGTGLAALALGCAATATEARANYSPAVVQQTTINLGSGDIGIGNYAYLLEQLEADF